MATVRVYRAEISTPVNTVRVYRLELEGVGTASPGPSVTNLEAWLNVKMTATADGVPTNYVWSQVAGPTVTLVASGPNNMYCTYETPALAANATLTFKVRAVYADGTSSGEGTCAHSVVRAALRMVNANGTFSFVKIRPAVGGDIPPPSPYPATNLYPATTLFP